MNTILLYLVEIAVTAGICLAVIAYLRPSLRHILTDLCGTEERAHFWLVFSGILLVGLPLVFGMGYTPQSGTAESVFFDIANQVKLNLFGFLLALFGTGCVISFFTLVAPRPSLK